MAKWDSWEVKRKELIWGKTLRSLHTHGNFFHHRVWLAIHDFMRKMRTGRHITWKPEAQGSKGRLGSMDKVIDWP